MKLDRFEFLTLWHFGKHVPPFRWKLTLCFRNPSCDSSIAGISKAARHRVLVMQGVMMLACTLTFTHAGGCYNGKTQTIVETNTWNPVHWPMLLNSSKYWSDEIKSWWVRSIHPLIFHFDLILRDLVGAGDYLQSSMGGRKGTVQWRMLALNSLSATF